MFNDYETVSLIISITAAAMVTRYFAIRFAERHGYTGKVRVVAVLTPMFATMLLLMNAWLYWQSWMSLGTILLITLVQVLVMLPIIVAFSFVPNPFTPRKKAPLGPDEGDARSAASN
jgi:hypothetical protein